MKIVYLGKYKQQLIKRNGLVSVFVALGIIGIFAINIFPERIPFWGFALWAIVLMIAIVEALYAPVATRFLHRIDIHTDK